MKIGVQTSSTDLTLTPQRLAVELEQRGFDTVLFAEHPHIPTARSLDLPSNHGGGEVPDHYKRTWDPFVACSYAAAATSRLEVGTGICLLALRDPIVTAKSIASIDVLSGGRFVFGVGFGWNADEFPDHGQDFTRRHAVVREKIGAMKSLWSDDVASYSGAHVTLAPCWSWPKPLTTPHPPILVGGDGPVAMKHAVRWADYWYPTSTALGEDPRQVVDSFKNLAEEHDRDPTEVGIWVVALHGTDEQALARYRDAGVTHVNLAMRALPAAEQLGELDRLTQLRDSLLS